MPDSDAYQAAMREAASAAWDKDWPRAIQAYQQALRLAPDDPQALIGLALSLMETHQHTEALRLLGRVSQLVPGDPLPHEKMAEIYRLAGDMEAAASEYLAAGEIYLARKDLQRAVPNWEQAVQLDPSLAKARMRLALAYERDSATHRQAVLEYLHLARLFQDEGQIARAEKSLQRALDIDPINPEVRNALDDLKRNKPIQVPLGLELIPPPERSTAASRPVIVDRQEEDQLLEAVDEAQQGRTPADEAARYAMERLADSIWNGNVPSSAQTSLLRALDAHQVGDAETAIEGYQQALQAGVADPGLRFCLGVLYAHTLQFDRAIELLNAAVHQPEYALAGHLMLGEAYFARGDVLEAAQHLLKTLQLADRQVSEVGDESGYERALASLPEQPPEHLSDLARSLAYYLDDPSWRAKLQQTLASYAAQGKTSYVQDLLEMIVEGGRPEIAEIMRRIDLYLERGMIDLASDEAHYAIERSPDYLPAHRRLADILLKSGRTQDAAAKLNLIAETYLIRGNADKATDLFVQAIDLWPADTSARRRVIDMMRNQGRVAEALHHYKELAELSHRVTADPDQTIAIYQEALDYAQRNGVEPKQLIPILRALADLESQRLNWRKALGYFEHILEADPDLEEAALATVDLHFQLGDTAGGVATLDRYLRRCVSVGKAERIVPVLQDQVRKHPNVIPLRQRLAEVYRQQGRVQEAVAQLDTIGDQLLEAGRLEDAIAVIRRIIALRPPGVEGYIQLLQQLESGKR